MSIVPGEVKARPHVSTLLWAVVAIMLVLGLYHLMSGRRRR